MYSQQTLARFWAKVNFSAPFGCWLWNAALTSRGYGKFNGEGRVVHAHRLAYLLTHPEESPNSHILHLCDVHYPVGDITNRRCVNPSHLTTGSHVQNMRRRDELGRSGSGKRSGELHGRAKLTDAQVIQIRALYSGRYGKSGMSGPALARMFGVAHPQIYRVIKRQTWDHV